MPEIWVAAKSFITFKRRVLIIKRSDYSLGSGEWDIPGGGIRFGETLPECLNREIHEETGLTVTIDKLLYAITAQVSPTRQIVGLTYLSHAETNKVTLSHEHTQFLWATKNQLKEHITPKTLEDYTKNNVFEILNID